MQFDDEARRENERVFIVLCTTTNNTIQNTLTHENHIT